MTEKETVDEEKFGCDVCMVNPLKEGDMFGTKVYDYKYMCTPSLLSWCKGVSPPPFFFGKDEKLPFFLSLFLGLQHCLAMVGGIATSGGYLITNDACLSWQKDSEMCSRKGWMISVAWLTSGLLTIVQVFRAKIKGTPFYLGTGLISVMGTSFTFLPIVRTMIVEAIVEAKKTDCTVTDGIVDFTGECAHNGDAKGAGAIGYGKFLGTVLVASLFEIALALVPPRILKKFFPPVVTGSAVMLIGGGLIGTGVKYWGGGVFCAENTESRSVTFGGPQTCGLDNGDVDLPFGSYEFVGLGFSVIGMSMLIQIFGSPFLKSTFLFWGLMFGCLCALGGKDIDHDGTPESFYRSDYTKAANDKPLTFLWAEGTFPISFDAVYLIPIIIGFIISTAESIGDITITCEFSGVTEADDVSSRVQGGLLADGVNSFLAALFGSPPNTTFSQNCGLIPITRCASRSVGFSCAFWLICLGIFSHFGAAFASIPICVVGGLVLQAFTAVFVAGMQLATSDFTRRNQLILMWALALGLGVAMEGHIFDWPGPYTFFRRNLAYDYGFWPEKYVCKKENAPWINENGICQGVGPFGANNGNCCAEYDDTAKMWRRTFLMILKTPYAIGFLVAFILNLAIPEDKDETEREQERAKKTASTPSLEVVTATETATSRA